MLGRRGKGLFLVVEEFLVEFEFLFVGEVRESFGIGVFFAEVSSLRAETVLVPKLVLDRLVFNCVLVLEDLALLLLTLFVRRKVKLVMFVLLWRLEFLLLF